MSSDEDFVFVTQNTFRHEADESDCSQVKVLSEIYPVYSPDVSDISEPETARSDGLLEEPSVSATSSKHNNPSDIYPVYMPDVSDISEPEPVGLLEKSPVSVTSKKPKNHSNGPSIANRRFGAPITDEVLLSLQSHRFADRTMDKIRWAVKTFKEWQVARNEVAPCLDKSPILVNIEEMSKDELNYCITRFLCEVKKIDGSDYPSETLYSFVICLQLFMDTLNKPYKFLVDDSLLLR